MFDRKNTRIHNFEFLKSELNLSQIGNSSVFQHNDHFFFSPAVSEGKHGKYWVDIREINLEKVNVGKTIFFPRIVPNLFMFLALEDLSELLTPNLMENRSNSGNVWGIYMNINLDQMTVKLVSKQDSSKIVNSRIYSKASICKVFNNISI